MKAKHAREKTNEYWMHEVEQIYQLIKIASAMGLDYIEYAGLNNTISLILEKEGYYVQCNPLWKRQGKIYW